VENLKMSELMARIAYQRAIDALKNVSEEVLKVDDEKIFMSGLGDKITDVKTKDTLKKSGLRGLSIAGCYALAIAEGTKTIELRTRPTNHTGIILLHCSQNKDYDFSYEQFGISHEECPKSSIVGIATLTGCVLYDTEEKWNKDREKFQWNVSWDEARAEYGGKKIYGYVFENPYVFSPPLLNVGGALGFWVAKDARQKEAFKEARKIIGDII
jgi:hypothetical protein